MDKKKMTMALSVLAVALMLATCFVITIPGESDAYQAQDFSANPVPGSPAKYNEARLWILGNADGDVDIDSNDVKILELAIEKKATVAQAPMCDTNNDGVIDADDVEALQAMILGTATDLNYYNVDGEIRNFIIYDKINMIAHHRCVVRSVTVLCNFDENVKLVGMDSSPYKEIEFNVSKNYPGCEDVGVTKDTDSEKLVALQDKYMVEDDECMVVLMGTKDYYLPNIEQWAENYDYQVVRISSWEGNPIEGILTTAYLFSGVGNDLSGDTCWDQALKYAEWAYGYLDTIEEQSSKIAEKDKKNILGIYTTTRNYEHADKTRGPGSGDHENFIACGGNSIATRFGSAAAADWTMEDIAAYCKDLDIMMLMSANCFSSNDFDADDDVKDLVEKMDGYVKKGTKIYAMTWALNGSPFVVQMVYYAKILMPDNSVIKNFDIQKAWDEYLKLVGWDKRTDISFDLDKVCSDINNPGETTTGDGGDGGSGGLSTTTIAIIAVVAVVAIAAVGFFIFKKR